MARAATVGRIAGLLLALAAGACGPRPAAREAPPPPSGPVLVSSNVLRADYAGSAECAYCHADIHEAWRRSPMRNMTRLADEAELRAPFDGSAFDFKGDRVVLERHDGRPYMRILSRRTGERLYRITKVIGGRYREDFAGVPLAGTTPDAPVHGDPRDDLVMPVSWLIFEDAFRLKGYSVMVKERPFVRPGPVWRRTCVFCHNTAPYLTTVLDDLHGEGAPTYQGSVTDRLLPPDRVWSLEVTDGAGLRRAIAEEMAHLGAPADAWRPLRGLLRDAIHATRDRLEARHLVEVGIGCEACHNGSREHAEHPPVRPTFAVRSPLFQVATPDGREPTEAEWINRSCARCHTVLFSRYPFTWEGGLRARDPGGSNVNSGEARDFLLGACSTRMSCVACHDPHAKDEPARMAELRTTAGNGVCLPCHGELAAPEALRAHTRHDPAGEGSACVACHMPRKNMGLAYALTAYHRIGSPTDPERVERDRPLECAICHPDRSARALVEQMEAWWGRRYDRGALRRLYGDLDANVLAVTLARGKAHEQATAIGILGERGTPDAIPWLVPHLAHELPLLRGYARVAIQALAGEAPPVDLHDDPEAIRAAAARWLEGVAHRLQ